MTATWWAQVSCFLLVTLAISEYCYWYERRQGFLHVLSSIYRMGFIVLSVRVLWMALV